MKIARFIKWSALNSAFGIATYLALYKDNQMADNVMVFFMWFFGILQILAPFMESARIDAKKRGRSVPEWLSVLMDMLIIASLAAFGRFVLATLWAAQMGAKMALFSEELQ